MTYLLGHWSYDPFLIVAAVLVAWHEAGLARLGRRSRPERTRQRRLRSLAFYGGLAVLLIAVESPVDYWSDSYFFVHVIQHLLLMFAAPPLVVAGAPWQPLLAALPGHLGRDAIGSVLRGRWSRPLRAAGGALLRPWPAVALFNIAMVFWHLPGPFDLAETSQAVHIWLMHGSFFATGVLFWLQVIPSPPLRTPITPAGQAAAVFMTSVVMWVLAMALSLFSRGSWYPVYDHVPGVTLPPFADQQIGAAILWVCGDFWAIPTMVVVMRRLIDAEGSIGAAVERILGQGSARYRWGSPAAAPGRGARRPVPPLPPGDGRTRY